MSYHTNRWYTARRHPVQLPADLPQRVRRPQQHIADVFGIMVKQMYENEDAEHADWLIGEGCLLPGVKGVALRSMKAPGTAYDDPRLVSPSYPLPSPINSYQHPHIGLRPPTRPHLENPRRAHLLRHPEPRFLSRIHCFRGLLVGEGGQDLVARADERAAVAELHVCAVHRCHGWCGGGAVWGRGG